MTTARNFVGQALAIQPSLAVSVETFWHNLNRSPRTDFATMAQAQIDRTNPIIVQHVRPLEPNPYGDQHEAFVWELYLNLEHSILDEIDYVQYDLHPTYENPERIVRDKKSNFRLRLIGWGTFEIPVHIHFKDGSVLETVHELQFPD